MRREENLERLGQESEPWDFVVIGGGATGLGVAVDAASRGYRVVLVEQSDFAKGTSSRSTKLLHGGVRYLRQGNIGLVVDALRERSLVCRNAPHVARSLGFVIPAYHWHEKGFYGVGLTVYDRLAGKLGFGRSRVLSREETLRRLPTVNPKGLRGGILYFDGQFDDGRLAVNLAQTATELGGVLVNYAKVVGFLREGERIVGVEVRDEEGGREFAVRARCVINATGVYCDGVRRMEDEAVKPMLVASQGSHLVLPREFQPGDDALMVPKTDDGRVLFALPWHDRLIVGTTDVPVDDIPIEPRSTKEEVGFLLEHAAKYLRKAPARDDVLSLFSGLRPLVSAPVRGRRSTSRLSRDHTVVVSPGGVVSVTGGKWTTYRKMADDVLSRAQQVAGMESRPCRTVDLRIHGWTTQVSGQEPWAVYGSDAEQVRSLVAGSSDLSQSLHERLPYVKAQVVWAARHEMARTVEDVLARRTRALFLDARASAEAAAETARLLAAELGRDRTWEDRQTAEYRRLAKNYWLD